MLKTPSSRPEGWKCDLRLPIEALAFRKSTPELLSHQGLGRINVTAWLYLDDHGDRQVKVNPNITLSQIHDEFGRAATRDAETPMLRNYFRSIPWFYYYDRNSWRGDGEALIKRAAEVLTTAYGL